MARGQKADETPKEENKELEAPSRKKLEKKSFSLTDYKVKTGLNDGVAYKPDVTIPINNLSNAFEDATGHKGIAVMGHANVIRGHTNSSKTTCLLETAVSAQKMGKLVVFCITEMKFSWSHLKLMGFEFEEKFDEDGVMYYDGFFIFNDKYKTIEDLGDFINNLLDDQEKGKLPCDLVFLVDSIGTLPCKMTLEGAGGTEHEARVYSSKFGKGIIPRINTSRRLTYPYTNNITMITQVWIERGSTPMEQSRISSKGGNAIPLGSSSILRTGNIKNNGINILKANKNGKKVDFAIRTGLTFEKVHTEDGIATSGKVIVTPHGYIYDDKKAIDDYKTKFADYWKKLLDTDSLDFDLSEEEDDNSKNFVSTEDE